MRLAVAAGGALLAVPHVAGFAIRPSTRQAEQAPRRPSAVPPHCCQTASTAVRSSSWPRSRGGEWPTSPRISRRRPWWAATQAVTTAQSSRSNSSSAWGVVNMMMISPASQAGTTASSAMPEGSDPSKQQGGLRLAVVGENADELGRRMAERYGLVATSMNELMKGRKGRKTDNVRAKAVSEWLAERGGASTGGVLTGFPTTETQAELLEKQGVDLEQLVVIARASAGTKAKGEGDSDVDNEEEEQQLLVTRLAGKVVELAGQQDVDSLCDSAASLLTFGEQQRRDTVVDGGVALPAEQKAAELSLSSPLSDADMVMSPTEHAAAHAKTGELYPEEGGSEAAEQRAQSLAGAEAKRAEKAALRKKKRLANQAQQLDTPFYVAVAQGGPKARFRAPVPMVKSRITERLSSAVAPGAGEGGVDDGAAAVVNTRLEFGPLVLDSPASDCLLAAGIKEPTGIQKAGMGPIFDGESVILHAMTGSGKTLTFLLPLLQRWAPGLFSPEAAAAAAAAANNKKKKGANSRRGVGEGADAEGDAPWQVLLALPTRELAVQVAREVVLLSGGLTASVELLVDASVFHDLSKVTAPIVVGSAKVLERLIRKSRPTVRNDVLPRVKCIVVDEVDRLVDVVSKHAPTREAEKRKRHARPIAALLERVLSANGEAQVVACSATIGRPLRRELGHIIRRASSASSFPDATAGHGDGDGDGGRGRRELRVIRDAFSESPDRNLATERAVVIPDTIRHYCVPLNDGDFFSRLEGLTAAVRELQPRRPLVFVPPQERVTAVVAHLRRAGGSVGARAVALHEAMGFVSDEDFGGVRGRHASEAIQRHDKLAGQFKAAAGGPDNNNAAADGNRSAGGGLLTGGRTGLEAAGRRLGGGSSGGGGGGEEAGDVLVTGEESARGLHFDDVDFVFLMQKPRSPDEYVHLAGRTGRQGKTGTVVSLVEFEEFRKLQGWSTSLKVNFEPLDILNVVNR